MIKSTYNIGQRYIAYILLISLFLQSCNQFSNPLIPIIEEAQESGDDNQQLDSQDSLKEVGDKNLITQGGNQKGIQKIVTSNNLTTQVDISMREKERKSHTIPVKPMQSEVIMSKTFEIATIPPAYSQEIGTQKCRTLAHLPPSTKQSKRTNQGELTQVDIKRKKATQAQVSLHQGGQMGKFDILPRDLLPGILSYLEAKEIGQVRQLNKSIYKLTTGYERPGMVGVENKPSTNCLVLRLNTRTVDFKKIQRLTPETISSFAFYQLMGQVRNLPSIFWKYIKGTNVHTVNLSSNQIGDSGATELAKNLQGTSVHTIDLADNQISDSGAAEFAKNLQGLSVHTVNLRNNQIGISGAAEFAKNLQGTSLHTVNLEGNQIGASGAAELAKNLKGTSIHTIYLGENKIGALGAAKFAKNLKETSVQFLDLSNNKIGALGAAELAKNLKGTSIHTIYLYGNQIGASGAAEFVKNLQGTSVHTINLEGNQIGALGAAELGKNLQGTSIRTIYLGGNQIGDLGAAELAKDLKETSVHTIILGSNQISDSGTAKFAKNLQGTSVHTIDLSFNQIGNSGAAEFAKNLKGSSVHTIYLSFNQIGALGAAEFAKNLQGTSLHTIYLWGNRIGSKAQNLLKKQYTNIQWIF
jgi:Ran GTPase-activating protein (RanGAP) involved in mRNA processing and transport